VGSYEETLVNISLDADDSLAFDTSQPYVGRTPPAGGSAVAGFQYRFVVGTGDHQVGLSTGAEGQRVAGVLQNKPQVEGMAATVAIFGISMVEAGGDLEPWDAVGTDATGRAVSGGDLGVAVYGGVEGDLVPVILRLHTTAAAA
jgi:hypothetical protein